MGVEVGVDSVEVGVEKVEVGVEVVEMGVGTVEGVEIVEVGVVVDGVVVEGVAIIKGGGEVIVIGVIWDHHCFDSRINEHSVIVQ